MQCFNAVVLLPPILEPPFGPSRRKDIDYGRLFNNAQANFVKTRNESSQTLQRFKTPQIHSQGTDFIDLCAQSPSACSHDHGEVAAQSAQCSDMRSPSGVVDINGRKRKR